MLETTGKSLDELQCCSSPNSGLATLASLRMHENLSSASPNPAVDHRVVVSLSTILWMHFCLFSDMQFFTH